MPYGNGFVDLLGGLRRGVFLEEAEMKLTKLIEEIEETGKAGSMTLTITLKPAKGDAARLVVSDKLALKEPQPEVGDTLMWVQGGRISRRDPRQPELPFVVDDQEEAIGG